MLSKWRHEARGRVMLRIQRPQVLVHVPVRSRNLAGQSQKHACNACEEHGFTALMDGFPPTAVTNLCPKPVTKGGCHRHRPLCYKPNTIVGHSHLVRQSLPLSQAKCPGYQPHTNFTLQLRLEVIHTDRFGAITGNLAPLHIMRKIVEKKTCTAIYVTSVYSSPYITLNNMGASIFFPIPQFLANQR